MRLFTGRTVLSVSNWQSPAPFPVRHATARYMGTLPATPAASNVVDIGDVRGGFVAHDSRGGRWSVFQAGKTCRSSERRSAYGPQNLVSNTMIMLATGLQLTLGFRLKLALGFGSDNELSSACSPRSTSTRVPGSPSGSPLRTGWR